MIQVCIYKDSLDIGIFRIKLDTQYLFYTKNYTIFNTVRLIAIFFIIKSIIIFIGIRSLNLNKIIFLFKIFRYLIRYQFAWENSKADYLFISHKDMVYNKDIIIGYLNKIDDHIAIGSVGQCCYCPAHKIHFDGTKYWEYRPNIFELRKFIYRI
jgi:hypothetical protein